MRGPRFLSLLLLLAFLLVPVVNSGCSGCGSGYSEGERSGYVVKLSKKGIVFKSFEGELRLAGGGLGGVGTDPTGWQFSVSDPKVADQVQEVATSGERVTLVYRQWLVSPTGVDTDYDIVAVKRTPQSTPAIPQSTPPPVQSADAATPSGG